MSEADSNVQRGPAVREQRGALEACKTFGVVVTSSQVFGASGTHLMPAGPQLCARNMHAMPDLVVGTTWPNP